jgi:hypothetical protein
LESDPSLASGTLFTVHGCAADEVYAVGGFDLVRWDGRAWDKVELPLTNQLNGVSCAGQGDLTLVGFGGAKLRLVSGAWTDDFAQPPYADLHAVWTSPKGARWAVGGDFLSKPAPGQGRRGVIARWGAGL